MATAGAYGSFVPRYAVEILLDDHPGALGLVASRIGEMGGDVVDIDVLEHFAGRVRDEITVDLVDEAAAGELALRLHQLEGVELEHVARLGELGHHLLVDALEVAAALVTEEEVGGMLEALARGVAAAFEPSWVAVIAEGRDVPLAATGCEPPPAILAGARSHFAQADDCLAFDLGHNWASLALARAGWPFRNRERRELAALARIAGARWAQLDRVRA